MARKVVLALLLGGIAAFCFWRSGRWEHGAPAGRGRNGKETVFWSTPLLVPALLGILCTGIVLATGWREGLIQCAALLAELTFNLSLYNLALLALLPVLRRVFSARACASLWVLPALWFYWSTMLHSANTPPLLFFYLPPFWAKLLTGVWLSGALLVFGGYCVQHRRFSRHILAQAAAVEQPVLTKLWQEELERMEYRRPVRLLYSPAAAAPFSMGNTNRSRVTVLPRTDYPAEEARLIFRHEIHHLQRCDVDTKIFLAFCRALFWFNPLLWLATARAADDLELSCDEIVVEGATPEERQRYARLLLQTAGEAGGFTTCLSGRARSLRYRLKNIVLPRRRRTGTGLMALTAFLCVFALGWAAVTGPRGRVDGDILPADAVLENATAQLDGTGEVADWQWKREELEEYLRGLSVEKINRLGLEMEYGGSWLEVFFTKGEERKILTLSDRILMVQPLGSARKSCYYLREGVDWGKVTACVDPEAEQPRAQQVDDPQLTLFLDDNTTVQAKRMELTAADGHETYRAEKHSGEGTVLTSGALTAKLSFSASVEPEDFELLCVTVQPEGERSTYSIFRKDLLDQGLTLPLKAENSRYEVRIVYQDRQEEAVRYEAVYRFQILRAA